VLISIATKDNVNEGKKLVEAIKFHHHDKELPVLLSGQAIRNMDDDCLDEIVNLVEKPVVIR
jgi:hypothetical protein